MEIKNTLIERLKTLQTQKSQAENMLTISTREAQRLGGCIDELVGVINHMNALEQEAAAAAAAPKVPAPKAPAPKAPAKKGITKISKDAPKKSVVASAVSQTKN